MSPAKQFAPNSAIRSEKEWERSSSRTLRKRSPQLKEIDSAVGEYHKALQTAADNYAKRTALTTNLLDKIQKWQETKTVVGEVKSIRASVVAELKNETVKEQDAIKDEKERAQALATSGLLATQQNAKFRPERVAIYSAGMLLNNDGSFAGATEQEYQAHKSALGEGSKEADIRLALLKTKLDQAYKEFIYNKAQDNKVLGIFTAPEWLFKKPGVSFTQEDKLYIEEKCKEYSTNYRDMLIVPGSTVWTKGDGDAMELRGTALALLNGELVHETHKQRMLGDEDGYDKKQMAGAWEKAKQTDKDSSLFMVGNRLIALEICGDHGQLRANEEQAATYGSDTGTDIHILVSKGAKLAKTFVTLKDGGIGVANDASTHSSGNAGVRTVFSAGIRKSNQAGSRSSHLYSDCKENTFSKPEQLNTLYMGTYQLPA